MAEVYRNLQCAEHRRTLQIVVILEFFQPLDLNLGRIVLVQIVRVISRAEFIDQLQHAPGFIIQELPADFHGNVVSGEGGSN